MQHVKQHESVPANVTQVQLDAGVVRTFQYRYRCCQSNTDTLPQPAEK